MSDPVLVLPGTQATTLRDGAGRVVYNAVEMSLPLVPKSLGGHPKSEWVPLMGLEYAPGELRPRRTSLLPGTEISAGAVVASAYQPLPPAWKRWPYDWRLDMRDNAMALLDDLRARAARGEGRATLVTHSQGGLIAVVASKLAAAGEFAALVSRAFLVAPPLAGTMRAAEALALGSPSLGKPDQPLALAMARSWPAIYQMLPAWPCAVDAAGNELPEDRQLLSPGGWPSRPGEPPVPDDMLQRARDAQALLRDPLAGFAGVEVAVVLGTDQQTPLALVREGDAFTGLRSEKKAGDDLVPYIRTLDHGGAAFRRTVRPFGAGVRPHAELCSDYTVAAYLRQRVGAPAAQPA